MFLRQTKLTFSFLLLISFFFTQNIQAKQGFDLTWSTINDIIDHISCDYNVTIPEAQMATWLEGLLAESGDCDGIDEVWSTSTSKNSESYRWREIPNNKTYTVASLGLGNGHRTRTKVKLAKHEFTPLTIQPYIFAFLSDCVSGPGTAAHIIIVDKDMFFTEDTNANCECPSTSANVPQDLTCSSLYNLNVYNFDWIESDYSEKYRFILNGNVGGISRNKEFWVIKGYSTELESMAIALLADCDEFYIPGTCIGCAEIGDEDFSVNFSQAGAHVYIMNPELNVTSFNVVTCGNDMEKRQIDEAEMDQQITVAPNPIRDNYQLEIPTLSEQQGSLEIFNAQGQKMMREEMNLSKGVNTFNYSLENLPSGVYYFNIQTENTQTTKKILKM